MFLDGLRQNLLKTKVKNIHKNTKQISENTRGEGVGFLVDSREFQDHKKLEELMLRVCKSGSNNLVVFSAEKNLEENEDHLFLSKKDFSIYGSLKNAKIQQFIAQPFKVLVSYYRTENVFLDFVSAQSEALFKVGISPDSSDFNDLTIHSKTEELQVFENELLKYLKLLNRID